MNLIRRLLAWLSLTVHDRARQYPDARDPDAAHAFKQQQRRWEIVTLRRLRREAASPKLSRALEQELRRRLQAQARSQPR